MTVIAVIGALATAAFLGYHVGRRAGSPRPTWAKRTSRPALGRLTISLIAMIAARRIQQHLRAERRRAATHASRLVAPLDILRAGVTRIRCY